MEQSDRREREMETLRKRLSRLSQAILRINESLDFDQVFQGVLDSARSLTSARYGVMKLLDDSGGVATVAYLVDLYLWGRDGMQQTGVDWVSIGRTKARVAASTSHCRRGPVRCRMRRRACLS